VYDSHGEGPVTAVRAVDRWFGYGDQATPTPSPTPTPTPTHVAPPTDPAVPPAIAPLAKTGAPLTVLLALAVLLVAIGLGILFAGLALPRPKGPRRTRE
jgi:hypothetical protein